MRTRLQLTTKVPEYLRNISGKFNRVSSILSQNIGWKVWILACFLGYGLTANAWTTASAGRFDSGFGTESDPYIIKTVGQFRYLQEEINAGRNVTAYYALGANIDFASETECTGVGNLNPFRGTFDGKGYTVSNWNSGAWDYNSEGFFDEISGATIKNIIFSNFKVLGSYNVGVVVGAALGGGTIQNCHVTGGKVTSHTMQIGGIIGLITGGNVEISSCSVNSFNILATTGHATSGWVKIRAGGIVGYIGNNATAHIKDCITSANFSGLNTTFYEVGGVIGNVDQGCSAYLYRVISRTAPPNCGEYTRGSAVGYASGSNSNVTCVASYFSNATYVGESGVSMPTAKTLPASVNQEWIWTNLERINDSGNSIASSSDGNQKWAYNSGNYPYLDAATIANKTYVVRVYKGDKILNLSPAKSSNTGNYYYLNSNENISLTITMNNRVHERAIVYCEENNGSKPSIKLAQGVNTHTLKRASDCRFSAVVEAIPYPTGLDKSEFDQWNSKVILSWAATNSSSLDGKWYIYRRKKGDTGAWTKTEGATLTKSSTSVNYRQEMSLTSTELNTTWTYTVAFVENGTTAPDSPDSVDANNKQTVDVNSTLSVSIQSFTATGQTNSIAIKFTVPKQLVNNTTSYYTLKRKLNNGNYENILSTQRFNGSGEYTYTDNNVTSNSCDTYKYQLEISFYDRTFTSAEISANTTGASQITQLKATKGEFPNQVLLSWESSKISPDAQERYKIFRRVANNPKDAGVEITTITTTSPNSTYADQQVIPGVYYAYTVILYQSCSSSYKEVSRKEDIGFTLSLGTVSGRITYGTGTAVENVNVMVLRNDLQGNDKQYHSLYSSGEGGSLLWQPESAYYSNLFGGDFSFQFWLNPAASNSGTVDLGGIRGVIPSISLIQSGNTYQISFNYYNTSNALTTVNTGNYKIAYNRFSHIVFTRQNNTLNCYIVNDENPDDIKYDLAKQVTNARKTIQSGTTGAIEIGKQFKGNIDEMRLWSKALTLDDIKRDYNRILTGSESNLVAYWTLDEGLSGYMFDVSRVGTVFNNNHGTSTLAVNDLIPTNNQLSLKAISDANGNYMIRGIPFSGEGSSYEIIPSLGVHQFQPAKHLRYINGTALVHNSTDFTDISSFKVKGKIVYDGGTYPVDGCSFQVDGKTLVKNDGSVITSDINGEFEIPVPIGIHEVTVVKTGHTFANNGKLIDEITGANLNYNSDLSNIIFKDQTKVRLIGHVVGGLNEHDKPVGFGETVNNIGVQKIVLKTEKQQYNLPTSTQTYNHNDGKYTIWRKTEGLQQDETTVECKQKEIEITISSRTGEFVAWVYPEAYTIQRITATGYANDIYNKNELLDLTKVAVPDKSYMQRNVRTWTEEITSPPHQGQLPTKITVEKTDTAYYHNQWTYYYQATPTFSVKQLEGSQSVDYFGDTKFTVSDALTGESNEVQLVNTSDNTYTFGLPVFTQGNPYQFTMEAYEMYRNNITGTSYTNPVTQGIVTINNGLSAGVQVEQLELDSLGNAVYGFNAGAPDLTTGQKDFFATIQIGDFSYYWDLGSTSQKAWLLGDKSTGSDFMTSGPDEITAILRDPPGSLSYAYIEKGTTVTMTESSETNYSQTLAVELEADLGFRLVTFAGIGAGVITENEIIADVTTGIETSITAKSAKEITSATTFTERFETSSDPLYVGHLGDVFIGNSTNIQYGLTNSITIQKNYNGTDPAFATGGGTASAYSIAPAKGFAYGKSFGTRFAYTLVELEGIMIPKWQDNLALLLKDPGTPVNESVIQNPVYVSKLAKDDPNFGKINTDLNAFGSAAAVPTKWDDGPSYKIYWPTGFKTTPAKIDNFQDSVIWYNNQINRWIEVLAQNEKEKVEMQKIGNYSLGSGTSIEWSKAHTSSSTSSYEYSFVVSPSLSQKQGGEICGVGVTCTLSQSHDIEHSDAHSSGSETSKTVGFVLQEEGDDDQITVDYGWTRSGTVAFSSRGGRTSCPYEGQVVSKYYQPGKHILSEATMQIEVPKIDVASATKVLNVPANRAATFELNLKNESETQEDVWFQLIVDDATNPDGAELKIDGFAIGNGRLFLVKAGEVLKKTLTVAKGPSADIYNNIGLILRSQCQHDPTDFLEDIGDTTYVSVEFVPACSNVILKEPVSNWITNTGTGDSIKVVLEGYDINFANFGYVQLEYRPASSSTWSTLMNFYSNQQLYNTAQGYKTLLQQSDRNITYWWNQKTIPDGNYELRATAVCLNAGSGVELSRYSAPGVSGVKDMTRPTALGLPSPSNGILSAGDELSILFNEDIQTGMLTKNNFTITGVLNGRTIAEPAVGLSFDGTGAAYTELPVYSNGSFSIETWFKRTPSTAGTLFAFGANENYISLGFDAAGKAVLTIGNEMYTSVDAIANTADWKYVSMAYDRSNKNASVYLFQGSDPVKVLFNAKQYAKEPETQGKLYIGAMSDKTNGFRGALSRIHLWKEARDKSAAASDMHLAKVGNERNLAGYWELNEGSGTIAEDKAMARNLTLKSNWYVYPEGKAVTLSGSNYLTINSSNFPFREYDNYSLEFWFKGGNQNAATLFSCGHGISDKDLNGRLSIAVDANKQLILRAKGETKVISTANVLDNNWNHLAMTVKRNGMLSVYINGKLAGQLSSSVIGSMQGSDYTFGACRYNNTAGVAQTTEYFTGSMDEIRVWNTVLTSDIIKLNMNSKLNGNEAGLKAYYPFEKYTRQSNGLVTVTETKSDMVDALLTAGGSTAYNNVSPAMKDCRPVEEVDFNFVSSHNKIVFTLNNELKELEGVILEVTAKDIYDIRGNISVPEKWTAFVNMNSLKWDTDAINLAMEVSTAKSFTAVIVNKSGENKDFVIENIPSWLSASQKQGTLKPLTSKEITFTVAQGVNIGSYEESIILTGLSGIDEMLPVHLKVTGQKPAWAVNPYDFESTMNITGQIKIEGAFQEDADDLLAAFIDDQCVGVTSPVYITASNAYFTFMDVYGNSPHNGKTIKFRLWDASTGQIYPNVELSGVTGGVIKFSPYDMSGSVRNPVIHNALNIIEQQIALNQGWTWFSVNVTNDDPSLINQFKTSIGSTGELLKGHVNYIERSGTSWSGNLTNITNTNMFAVNTNKSHTLKLEGRPVDVSSTNLLLLEGWNWIGYTPQYSLPVKSALAGINAQEGDQIKAQAGYATYMGESGWIGSLTYMQPGKGYMYYSGSSATQFFTYPNVQESMLRAPAMKTMTFQNKWSVDYHRFPNNMTVTSMVLLNGDEVLSNNVEIAAFAGGECRGSVFLQYEHDLANPYVGFLMVYGASGEEFQFRMYDHDTEEEYISTNPPIQFESNKRFGSLSAPYALQFGETSGEQANMPVHDIIIYPNPATATLWIKRNVETINAVEVLDLSGRIVYQANNFKARSLNVSGFKSGYYMLKMTIDGNIYHQQFIKK